MKTWKQHYSEFKAYCRTLSNKQLANVVREERQRKNDNPDDECYDACHAAARDEEQRRYFD